MRHTLLPLTLLLLTSACSTQPPAVVSVQCAADETACNTTCAKLKTDDLNCGSCGRACGDGSACANAACHPTTCNGTACDPSSVCFENTCTDKSCVGVSCPSGTVCALGACVCATGRVDCSGKCVDTDSDDTNCGACGTACSATESCAQGACLPDDCGSTDCDPLSVCYRGECTERTCVGVTCEGGKVCSQGACVCPTGRLTCSSACVDPLSDDSACGGCGTTCSPSETCAQGACLPDDCPNTQCDPLSVCFQGACVEIACVGVACPSGQVCRSGACGCPAGATVCNGACTDPKQDEGNCGTCGRTCSATETCAAGACFPQDCPSAQCDPLSACYQGTCTEVACIGVTCPGGQVCSGGACACPAGKTLCGGQCVDPSGDVANCGRCGQACTASQSCTGGNCVTDTCMGTQTLCGSSCVETSTDPNNCGACGAACGGGRNCVNGTCACPSGLTFCGTQCLNLSSDGMNCGACGRSCGAGACTNGTCACPSGQTLCNGTCVTLSTDGTNCGQCGRTCNSMQVCSGGVCACPPGQTSCNGQCINTTNDNVNCGGCNVVCASGRYCSNSTCVTPFTCQANFNAAPADCGAFPTNMNACGVPTLASTAGPFTASISTTGMFVEYPIDLLPSQRVRVTGGFTSTGSGANYRLGILTDAGSEITAQTGTGPSTSTAIEIIDLPGNAAWCTDPKLARVTKTIGTTLNSSVTIEKFSTNGRFNAGGLQVLSPTALATNTAGRSCEQVCGSLTLGCGGSRQAFSAVIPAGKAADVVMTVRSGVSSGAIFYLYAYDVNGASICTLTGNQLVNLQYESFTSRLVNNTSQPQTVILQPSLTTGGGLESPFHLSVGIEP